MYVVAVADDVTEIKYALAGVPWVTVVDEAAVVPEFNLHNLRGPSWFKQQIVKLWSHRLVQTPYYLILDADCVLLREITEDMLCPGGKGLVQRQGYDWLWYKWFSGSMRLLSLNHLPPFPVNVTPYVMNASLAGATVGRLFELYGAKTVERMLHVAREDQWSEYTLYHCWSDYCQRFWSYHVLGPEYCVYCECVWDSRQLEGFTLQPAIDRGTLFTVIQSNCKLSVDVVRALVAPLGLEA